MIHMTTCAWGFVCAVCVMGLVSVTHVGVSGAVDHKPVPGPVALPLGS
jgi:hypothetical protein